MERPEENTVGLAKYPAMETEIIKQTEQSECKNKVTMIYEGSSCSWLADDKNQLTATVSLKQMVNVKNRKLVKILCHVVDRSSY